MTKDIVVGDELPDWVGAKEFYQKYDPKEVIGRWVPPRNNSQYSGAIQYIIILYCSNCVAGGLAVWCAGVCTDTRVRSWQ